MLAGISTACLYPLYTEKALAALAKQGVQSAEIFINAGEELKPDFVKKLRDTAKGHGVKILSLHPYISAMDSLLFFGGYNRRFKEGMEIYKRHYQAANILEAKIVVFHGAFHGINLSNDEYFNRFGLLVDDAITNGCMLCHENVSRCVGKTADFFARLSPAVPKARFVLDIKQAVRSGGDIYNFVGVMSGKIEHIHFSDHDGSRDCLPPGKGAFNIKKFLNSVRKTGFDGGVVVELYRDNFGQNVELFAGYQHLLTEISTVQQNDENYDKTRQNM